MEKEFIKEFAEIEDINERINIISNTASQVLPGESFEEPLNAEQIQNYKEEISEKSIEISNLEDKIKPLTKEKSELKSYVNRTVSELKKGSYKRTDNLYVIEDPTDEKYNLIISDTGFIVSRKRKPNFEQKTLFTLQKAV